MTVQELLERVSSQELTEWMAFFRLEPWGTDVWDLRVGLIAAMIANIMRDSKSTSFSPADFMPRWDAAPRQPEQSWEEQARILDMWGRAVAKVEEGGS